MVLFGEERIPSCSRSSWEAGWGFLAPNNVEQIVGPRLCCSLPPSVWLPGLLGWEKDGKGKAWYSFQMPT